MLIYCKYIVVSIGNDFLSKGINLIKPIKILLLFLNHQQYTKIIINEVFV